MSIEPEQRLSHSPEAGDPETGTPPERLENLIRSLSRQNSRALKANFIECSKYLWDIRKAFWAEDVDDMLRGKVLTALRPMVNRLDGVTTQREKDDLLRRILDLASQEDIQRALLVATVPPPETYIPTANEQLYLEGSGWIGEFCLWSRYNQINLAHLFWSGVFCVAAAASNFRCHLGIASCFFSHRTSASFILGLVSSRVGGIWSMQRSQGQNSLVFIVSACPP